MREQHDLAVRMLGRLVRGTSVLRATVAPVELTNQETARLARERVVRELRRRGAGDVTEVKIGNIFEFHATDASGRREVTLRVKTKSSGDWQTTTGIGEPREEETAETKFWILLDTGQRGADGPGYFVVPDWWMCNYVHLQPTRRRS